MCVCVCVCVCVCYLALPLLVLQRTVKQNDTRLFDHPSHSRVSHVFVDHHSSEDTRVLDDPTWNLNASQSVTGSVGGSVRGSVRYSGRKWYLLHFGVLLDVNLFAPVVIQLDGLDSIQRDAAGQLRPAAQRLGVDGRVDNLQHHGAVRRVHRGADGTDVNQSGPTRKSLQHHQLEHSNKLTNN